MNDDIQVIYESAIAEYRQNLATAQWELAQANGRIKARDAIIAELNETNAASPPKPSPR